jgi:hypothetical protein
MSSRRSREARQAYADHVQAMKQIFAKQPLPDALFEVLVRCGDDAHLGLERRVAADAVVVAIGQHAQQPRLQLGRHVADLVEKQGAALGLLEATLTLHRGTGECAALVTEEFGFEQVARESRRC